MVAKILSTSSSKFQRFNLVWILSVFCLTFSCFAQRPDWIRSLPKEEQSYIHRKEMPKPEGIFKKRTNPKSTVHSPNFKNEWNEEIEIFSNGKFEKRFTQSVEKKAKEPEWETSLGKGEWNQNGVWVLLQTTSIVRKTCVDASLKSCKMIEEKYESGKPIHSLLYHFDGNSLVSLQYESNYKEADFGVAWEVKEPYKESSWFNNARKKYASKEFQPHAYFSVKLD